MSVRWRVPTAPVSPAYSLMSHDHQKLKYLFDLVKPALVLVQDAAQFAKALHALDLGGVHGARAQHGADLRCHRMVTLAMPAQIELGLLAEIFEVRHGRVDGVLVRRWA